LTGGDEDALWLVVRGGGVGTRVVVVGRGGGAGGALAGNDGAAVDPDEPAAGNADRSLPTGGLEAEAGRATSSGPAAHAAMRPHAIASATTITERFDVRVNTASGTGMHLLSVHGDGY
jgi:hypothetical protein